MKSIKGLMIVLICLCMTVQYSKEITTVSQNVNGTLETYCVTNNESETLSWITPYDESFYNFKRDKPSNISKFDSGDWKFEHSFQSYFGAVVDPRWQNFENFVSQNNNEVRKTLNEHLKDYFELTFSIKYYEDAKMLIYYYNSLKQIISFKDNILSMSICPDEISVNYCYKYINVTQNLKNYVFYNLHTWNHFTIRFNKDNNILSLLLNNVFIKQNTVPYYGITGIIMKSYKGAIWKLHMYDYYLTISDVTENIFLKYIQASNNKLCMSGYFYFEHELTIQIRQDTTIIKEDTFINDEGRWKFIKIEENVYGDTVKQYTFWIKHGKLFTVYFSHIKLNSDCDTDVNKIYAEFNVSEIEQVSCESLNNPSSYIRMGNSNTNIGSACPVDAFGNDCIKCKSVFNTDICEETLTCAETNKCYCQPGYHGKHCKQKCYKLNNNVFGSNCIENCGHCMDNKQCHHVTGHCTNGCEEYFLEPFCNETDLPYLKEAPVAQTPCYTTCNVNFNPEMYEGCKMPDSYKVEIYENNGWKVVNKKHINDRDISVDKLNILTDYRLRIILCHNDECMEGKYVPILNFTTDCKVEDLRGIWDEDMVLTLSWSFFKDRDKEIVFEISYNDKYVAFAETKENLYQVHSTLICPAKKEFAKVAVRIKIDESVFGWITVEVACPPQPPTFGNNPIIAFPIQSSTSSFKLLLPPFQNPTNRSYISVFVEQTDNEKTKDDCDPIKLSLKATFPICSVHLAAHMQVTKPYDMLTINIGEKPTKRSFSELLNCSYENALLSAKEKSTFYVVMTSADDRLTVKRSTLYVVPVASIDEFRTPSMAT